MAVVRHTHTHRRGVSNINIILYKKILFVVIRNCFVCERMMSNFIFILRYACVCVFVSAKKPIFTTFIYVYHFLSFCLIRVNVSETKTSRFYEPSDCFDKSIRLSITIEWSRERKNRMAQWRRQRIAALCTHGTLYQCENFSLKTVIEFKYLKIQFTYTNWCF